jgi:hypothetical protein
MKPIKNGINTNISMVYVDWGDVDKFVFSFIYSITTTAVLVFHLSSSLYYFSIIYQQIQSDKKFYPVRYFMCYRNFDINLIFNEPNFCLKICERILLFITFVYISSFKRCSIF